MARHAMVTKVRGSIPVREATAYLNAGDPAASSVHVVLDVAGIETGNTEPATPTCAPADFLDAAGHPSITFDSTDVKHVGG
ncbi:YceI family protein [Streptosporangium vulgare]|uniref:YceI family protein n=1 Tax=Streptosporangium vulgare TaxID=46190 RepID=UPI0031DA5C77